MTNHDSTPARLRLDAALEGVAAAFRGMTAHPDETNCSCHWGSAEEVALLKVPDVELTPDLLRRTVVEGDWVDRAAVLRRVLPQLSRAIVNGLLSAFDLSRWTDNLLAYSGWQRWPAEQTEAIREFLHAWWSHTLTDPNPAVPPHEVLALCAEAEGSAPLAPWLDAWETMTGPTADAHVVEALEHWECDLLTGCLPWWSTAEDEEAKRAELTAWVLRHAPARLRGHDQSAELLEGIRLLRIPSPDRYADPQWTTYFSY